MRSHTKPAAVLLAAAVAGSACWSSAGPAATAHSGVGGSGPATVSTRASSLTTSSSLTNGTLTTNGTPSTGSSSIRGSSAGQLVPPPAGWKAVWYHSVGANIPTSWQVAPGTSFVCSFGATPVAYLGPTHTFYPCPMPAPGHPGNNGLWIDASYGTPGASMIETSVHGIAVDIGVAANPIIAHRIEASLRYDPGQKTGHPLQA